MQIIKNKYFNEYQQVKNERANNPQRPLVKTANQPS